MAWTDATGRQVHRRMLAASVDAGFSGLSRVGATVPAAWPSRQGLERQRDLPYTDPPDALRRLDVYRPATGAGDLPVVLYLHGGGFRALSKDTHWLMGLAFARRGYVVFNANYRLAPAHRYPAALEDACAALAWVRAHARDHGGDPDRVVLAGESAGANLALALALVASNPRPEAFARATFENGAIPRAVLPACGVFQVSDAERVMRRRKIPWPVAQILRDVEDTYLGPPEARIQAPLADPLCLIEDTRQALTVPPCFLTVGTKDPLLDDTRRLEAALLRREVTHEARYYPGEVHAFHALLWRKAAWDCWKHMLAFTAAHA